MHVSLFEQDCSGQKTNFNGSTLLYLVSVDKLVGETYQHWLVVDCERWIDISVDIDTSNCNSKLEV